MRELYASFQAKNVEKKVTFSDNSPDSWSGVPPDSIDREQLNGNCFSVVNLLVYMLVS